MSKAEYKIPGLEHMGVPGRRNDAAVSAITDVIDKYKGGESVVLTRTGKPATVAEIPFLDASTSTELVNMPTSMESGLATSGEVANKDSTTLGFEEKGGTKAQGESPFASSNPRRDALINPLTEACVMIVGLGGGAPIPFELAKCGVRQFILIDHDVLGPENLIRHPCGVEHLGKPKVQAVSDALQTHTGGTLDIKALSADVFSLPELDALIASVDLIVVATDNEASRFFMNEHAVKHATPAVFVGTFESAIGGEVVAHQPGEGCYICLAEHIGRKEFLKTYQATVDKSTCTSSRDVCAVPGLGADQGILCHIATRKCLDILVQKQKHNLPTIGSNWIVFSTSGIPTILPSSLTSMQRDIPRHSNCYVCGTSRNF
jgi:molybdopterin/thiamine biosynthesis adenylyltransferase